MRRRIGKSESETILFKKSIKGLGLTDFDWIKQADGQIRLRETKLACMENLN